MTTFDYSNIRRQLEEMKLDAAGSQAEKRRNPALDFGLFLLLYFAALVLTATAMLAVGMPLQQYTALYALPLAWLMLALLRKAPLYSLLIAICGVLYLAAAGLLAGQFFDTAQDSASYHKVSVGLLANGWNPFTQTMSAYANTAAGLPYQAGWLPYLADNQPNAASIIAACAYALTGNLAYGKVFNLTGMIAAVCIVAPLIKHSFKLSGFGALFAVCFAVFNPVTLGQVFTYYPDGFAYQLLTIGAASFASSAYKPHGRYAPAAKAAAFAAIGLAVNVTASAILYAALICAVYYGARVIAIARSGRSRNTRSKQQWGLFAYFLCLGITAFGVLGATTYALNFLRYGNPLHGMYTALFANAANDALLAPDISALPLFAQFMISLLSPVSAGTFAGITLKIPFTFTSVELTLATLDAATGGWGLLFSGIMAVSLVILVISLILLAIRRSRRAILLIIALIVVMLPPVFLPYLFKARHYMLLFWLPSIALCCLFAAQTHTFWLRFLAAALGMLLAFNCVTAYNSLLAQAQTTADARQTIAAIITETEGGDTALDIAVAAGGPYAGLLFTLQDAGITEYNAIAAIPESQITGTVLELLSYRLRASGGDPYRDANAFLAGLYQNGYLIVITKQGACGALTTDMLALLEPLGLQIDGHNSLTELYLAVLGADASILAEETGIDAIAAEVTTSGLTVQAESSLTAASVSIGGTEYALGQAGYNIVVFDAESRTLVDSVVIEPDTIPALLR